MKEVLIILISIILAAGALFKIAFKLDEISCHKTAEVMGVKCSYDIMTGCIIEVNGKKIPLENYRGLEN